MWHKSSSDDISNLVPFCNLEHIMTFLIYTAINFTYYLLVESVPYHQRQHMVASHGRSGRSPVLLLCMRMTTSRSQMMLTVWQKSQVRGKEYMVQIHTNHTFKAQIVYMFMKSQITIIVHHKHSTGSEHNVVIFNENADCVTQTANYTIQCQRHALS